LKDIQSGAFAERWVNAYRNEKARAFEKYLDELDSHPIEEVGRKLRRMMWPEDALNTDSSRPSSWSKLQNQQERRRPTKKKSGRKRGKPGSLRKKTTTPASATKRTAGRQSKNSIEILDATLRERTFGVSFAVGEKLAIASMLDSLGVAYVESTLTTNNPKDAEYLKEVNNTLRRGGTEAVLHLRPEFFQSKKISDGSAATDAKKEDGASSLPNTILKVSFEGNCW